MKSLVGVIESLGTLLSEKIQTPTNLTDTLGYYLGYESMEVRIATSYAYNYIVEAYPRYRAQMISGLIHSITLSRGELTTVSAEEITNENIKF